MSFSRRWKVEMGFLDRPLDQKPESWFSLVHPDDLPPLLEQLNAHLKGVSERLEMEHRVRLPNGRHRWVRTRALVLRDAAGNPERIVGSQIDLARSASPGPALERPEQAERRDQLTGLADREGFRAILERESGHARNERSCNFAVAVLDLRAFDDSPAPSRELLAEAPPGWGRTTPSPASRQAASARCFETSATAPTPSCALNASATPSAPRFRPRTPACI